MRALEQQTLAQPFTLEGIGIHTGAHTAVNIAPAPADTGRCFRIGAATIPARADYVVDTLRGTTLAAAGAQVRTVEHLLSALHVCGVDNVWIDVDGPEIPILDGSAQPFVEAILAAGIQGQARPAREVTLAKPLEVQEGDSRIVASPAYGFQVEVRTEFTDWPQGSVTLKATVGPETPACYTAEIAPARTFAFAWEVAALQDQGLARGGSLENALIITPPDTFSTPLRLPAEWCAHKLLDVIGDLALADARLNLRLTAVRPGHRINTRFAHALLTQYGQA